MHWALGLGTAILLSTMVTILLARLSESQFLISVTVNDLWGAIASGFLITAAGPTVLEKFTKLFGAGEGGKKVPGKAEELVMGEPEPDAGIRVPAGQNGSRRGHETAEEEAEFAMASKDGDHSNRG